jgi:hypothetical protein
MSKKFFENKKYLLVGICIGIILGLAVMLIIKPIIEKMVISIKKTITVTQTIISKEITIFVSQTIKTETTKPSEKGKVIASFEVSSLSFKNIHKNKKI